MKFLLNFWDGFCVNDCKSSCIASHLHYNNVSCILDVCLLCCNDCVLLGLDWADPMIFFFVCISHVHAFSCIRTFKFLYYYILSCWCFFDCLPLSFFLFLSCVSLLYGIQTQIHSILEPSSFWGIFFL